MLGKRMARARVGSKPAGVTGGSDSRTMIRRGFDPRWPLINSHPPPLRADAYLDHGPGPNTNLKLGYLGPST